MSACSSSPTSPNTQGQVWQKRLLAACKANGMSDPQYQLVSDRRGGRTAWSIILFLAGFEFCCARNWYDGNYVNNAKEDAAEVALKRLASHEGARYCYGVGDSKGRADEVVLSPQCAPYRYGGNCQVGNAKAESPWG